ncbi:MAG: TRAP transporter small permease [Deltaproteobacteria bacterium]|nr:TRAP transporter small permease [Deltaproteobacteria bacterium]
MERIINIWRIIGKICQVIAGMALILLFMLTLSEVLGRGLWRAVPGAWEMISFLGGIVIGFTVPYTGQSGGHVNVDFLVKKIQGAPQKIINATTRAMVMIFSALIGWSLISMGSNFRAAHEVSQTMKIPFYPVAWCLGGMFMIQSFHLLLLIIVIIGGKQDE